MQEIQTEALYPYPVYDLATFGEEVVMVFPANLDNSMLPAGRNRHMLPQDATSYGGATLEILAAAGAVSTFDETFEFMVDMPAWCFLISPLIITRLVAGAGNTDTLSCQLIISILNGRVLYNETVTLAGLVADATIPAYLPEKGALELLPQHAIILVRLVVTSTRTAGAANTQGGFRQNQIDNMRSHVRFHLHPDKTHATAVLQSRKIDV